MSLLLGGRLICRSASPLRATQLAADLGHTRSIGGFQTEALNPLDLALDFLRRLAEALRTSPALLQLG